jgi:hypothetical protein
MTADDLIAGNIFLSGRRHIGLGRDRTIFLAFSISFLRSVERPLPARLMKYWIIRIPEPIPLGLTFLLAMMRAIDLASLVSLCRGSHRVGASC